MLSALAHVVLTPAAALVGVFAWLLRDPLPEETGPAEQLTSIPITLLGEQALPPEPPPPVPGDVELARATAPAPPPPEETKPAVEPAAGKEEPPAPPRQPPPPQPNRRGGIAHPVAMAGVTSEVVDSNANVNLLLMTERLREHPLGDRISQLLVDFPQWSSFFASAGVDPVRDLDRILIVGPQFRRSADVVAILSHRLSENSLRSAVDRLVQRPPKGRWLPGKLPIALAHADRAERLFALTAPGVLVVSPPHLQASLLANPPRTFPSPPGDEALVLHVRTPWRALIGLPFGLPESLVWLRLDVTALPDGGAQLRISAEDETAELAREHAESLTLGVNAATHPDLGPLGALVGLRSIALIDRVKLHAKDKVITGQVRISPRQLQRLLGAAEGFLAEWTGRRYVSPAGRGGAGASGELRGSRRLSRPDAPASAGDP